MFFKYEKDILDILLGVLIKSMFDNVLEIIGEFVSCKLATAGIGKCYITRFYPKFISDIILNIDKFMDIKVNLIIIKFYHKNK
jgi:hypothetical protein